MGPRPTASESEAPVGDKSPKNAKKSAKQKSDLRMTKDRKKKQTQGVPAE